jgi:hypothetical protein
MKQHKIEKQTDLLNDSGYLIEPGYAFKPFINYNPEQIKACIWRIKEWDYFLIGNKDFALSMTLANNRYMGICSIQLFDFKSQKKHDYTKFIFMPKFLMPKQAFEDSVSFDSKEIELSFSYEEDRVHIKGRTKSLNQEDNIEVNVTLDIQNKDHCHMVIPFDRKPKAFYFNQKYNNLSAIGSFKKGELTTSLNNIFGVLDWGRGVWPWKVQWYWSSMSGKLDNGKSIGFNLGYGFGNTKNTTENMIFYEGKGYKLDNVIFDIPKKYTDTWKIKDDKEELDLIFEPIFDNYTNLNYILLGQNAHQVFGTFSGKIKIDDGFIHIDNLFGFAERVNNRW